MNQKINIENINPETIESILNFFPKNKDGVLKQELINLIENNCKIEIPTERLIIALKREHYIDITYANQNLLGYKITDKGLDFNKNDAGKDYILRKLLENDGYYNLYTLSGKVFKNSFERIQIINELVSDNIIERNHSGFTQSYKLTNNYITNEARKILNSYISYLKETVEKNLDLINYMDNHRIYLVLRKRVLSLASNSNDITI